MNESFKRVKAVHKQFNSPIRLYSPEALAGVLNRHSRLLPNGAMGIDFGLLAAPNLAHSEVYKMVAEEQRLPWQLQNVTSSEMKRVAWPPPAPSTKPATETNEELEFTARESNQEVSSSSEVSQLTQVSQVIEGTVPVVADSQSPSYSSVISHQKEGENQENEMVDAADAFASNELVGERKIIDKPALPAGFLLQPFKLKEEAPITQKPHDIITSEPIFKQATPLRKLGDMVWPPKSGSSNNGEVVMSQDAIPSRRQQKNYQSFFGQHQLNASFPMYRAPPGTQHFGLEEGENATPM